MKQKWKLEQMTQHYCSGNWRSFRSAPAWAPCGSCLVPGAFCLLCFVQLELKLSTSEHTTRINRAQGQGGCGAGGSTSPEMYFKDRKIEIIIATATDSKRSLFSTIVTDEKEFPIYSTTYIQIYIYCLLSGGQKSTLVAGLFLQSVCGLNGCESCSNYGLNLLNT